MIKDARTSKRAAIGSILLYGLTLGLSLAALQLARYRFLVFDLSQEWYIGIIAVFFMVLGLWAGFRFRNSRSQAAPPAPAQPDAGAETLPALEALGITPREYEVLQGIAEGLSNQEIAARMFVSLNTIKSHTSNLFAKLDVQRRTQAVQKAQALGLLAGTHPKV